MSSFVEKLLKSSKDVSVLYEDESYFFLQYYQSSKKWFTYDSKAMDISFVKALADRFVSLHGKIPFATEVTQHFAKDQLSSGYWSVIPLGIFRYKMSDNGFYILVDSIKNPLGYLVEGAYWDNGFFYIVKDTENIIQIKLFIDQETKDIYAYPDVQ